MIHDRLPHYPTRDLLQELEGLRTTLVTLVEQGRDLDDRQVLTVSRELDEIINQFMEILPAPANSLLDD